MSEVFEIEIDKLSYGGEGVGTRVDGIKVFVPYSAPDEVLKVKSVKVHKRHIEAEIVEVIKPSPNRIEPKCPYYYDCGGCHWQHMDYATQIHWKQIVLEETLKRIGQIKDVTIFPTVPSPKHWGYRNHIRVHADKDGKIGFFAGSSMDIVEIQRCIISDDEVNDFLKMIKDRGPFIDEDIELGKDDHGTFQQANTLQNENLQKMICDWMKPLPHDNVVELYCGGGNFTFSIKDIVKSVTAVDSHEGGIAHAKNRVKKEKINNLEFICDTAYNYIKENKKDLKDRVDCLLMDPPRSGADAIIPEIVEIMPKSILYVSCNPSTMARDLTGLTSSGYVLEKVQPIDMFPQTYHIEALALLRPKSL